MARLRDPKVMLGMILIVAAMVASRLLLPVPLPHIQLPAEAIPGLRAIRIPLVGDLAITNTMVAILVADLLLIVLALLVRRRLTLVPGGLQNVVEALIEWWHGTAVQMLGEVNARRWLPLVLTVFLVVVTSNWTELVPGYDTVGYFFRPEQGATGGDEGQEHTLFRVRWLGEEGASLGVGLSRAAEAGEAAARASSDPASGAEASESEGWAFVPFLRVAASDLNVTLALALICFVAIEIVGLQSAGLGYLRKFIYVDFSKGAFMGILNIFVGLLELISEFARIISFAFRLFGNIFAGQTLLFVIPFLIPFLAVVPVYGLELFVGAIQGFVFAILTLAFMSVAMVSHGDGNQH